MLMAGLVPTDCCNIKHHIGRVGVTSEAFNTSKSYGSPKNHNNQRDLRICQKVPSQNPQRDTVFGHVFFSQAMRVESGEILNKMEPSFWRRVCCHAFLWKTHSSQHI